MVTKYQLSVRKVVWAASKSAVQSWRSGESEPPQVGPKSAVFVRETSLPFPPTVGLGLQEEDWRCGPLYAVRWVSSEHAFACEVEEEFASETAAFDAAVSRAEAEGWTREGGQAPGWLRGIAKSG